MNELNESIIRKLVAESLKNLLKEEGEEMGSVSNPDFSTLLGDNQKENFNALEDIKSALQACIERGINPLDVLIKHIRFDDDEKFTDGLIDWILMYIKNSTDQEELEIIADEMWEDIEG